MAKLTAPLMALKAIGTIAGKITFTRGKDGVIAKRKPIPTDPRTPGQLAQRDKVSGCAIQWQALTPSEKQDYIDQAKGAKQTAFGIFLTACLMAPPTTATLDGTITIQTGGKGNLVLRFFTPGTTTEVLRYATAVPISGTFTITGITPGTYDIGVKTDKCLSKLVTNKVFTAGNTTNVAFGTLMSGDVTDDDLCGYSDYIQVLVNFDLRGDCIAYPGNWLMP